MVTAELGMEMFHEKNIEDIRMTHQEYIRCHDQAKQIWALSAPTHPPLNWITGVEIFSRKFEVSSLLIEAFSFL
jgi:hypothetical protein